jgi:hypothetical protein
MCARSENSSSYAIAVSGDRECVSRIQERRAAPFENPDEIAGLVFGFLRRHYLIQ